MSFKDWWEDMGDTWLFKAAKSTGRTGAKFIQYGGAPAGALLFGLPGAIIGTGLAAGAGQVGPTKNAGAQLQRDLISGAAVTAGTSLFGVVSGAGFGASLIDSVNSLFGYGGTPPAQSNVPPKPMSDYDLQNAFLGSNPSKPAPTQGGQGGFNPTGFLGNLFGTGVGGPQANTADLQRQYQDQLALAEKYRQAGDTAGAAQAAALAEMYRQQLAAAGQAPGSGGMSPLLLLLLIGGGAWLIFRKK